MTTLTFVVDHAQASSVGAAICLGSGAPKLDYGIGWTEVARPKRPGFLDWEGRTLMRQAVPIELNSYAAGTPAQALFDFIESLALPATAGPPPVLQLAGPVYHTELSWVLESIDWSDDAVREDGQLMKVSATLTFAEHQSADIVKVERPKKTGPRRHRVKKGETLQGIAAKDLGDAKRWPEILKLNRKTIKNSRKLKVGALLTLPNK